MPGTQSILVSAGDDIKVWDSEHMQIIKQYNHHESNIKDVAWSQDNRLLASTGSNGACISLCEPDVKDHAKARLIGKFAKGEQQTAVTFGSRSRVIFSGGSSGDVNAWDSGTGKLLKHFNGGHQSPVTCIAVNSHDTQVVSACTYGEMAVWDAETGDCSVNLQAKQSKAIRGLDHSLQNEFLFGTASDDGSVRLWDIDRQILTHEFSNSHLAPAMDLSFTPLNHLLLASCGLDKKFKLYDIQNKNTIKTYTGDHPWTTICFLGNGMHLTVGSSLGSLYKFDLRKLDEALDSVTAHSTSVQRLIPQNFTRKSSSSRSSTRSANSVSSVTSVRKPKESSEKQAKLLNEKATSARKVDTKSKLPKKNSVDTNGNRPHIVTHGTSNRKHTVESKSDPDIANGNAVPNLDTKRHHNLNAGTPAVNKSHSSNRDTLGSYCEGVFSPIAADHRSTPFVDLKETDFDTEPKQHLKTGAVNGVGVPAYMTENKNGDAAKSSLKPSRLSKGRSGQKREAWASSERHTQPMLTREGDVGRESLGSYCEGVFSPLARPEHDDPHDVFARGNGRSQMGEREKLTGSFIENKDEKTRTKTLAITTHGNTLKPPSPSYFSKPNSHPPSPMSYGARTGKTLSPKQSSPSQSDSDSYQESPPRPAQGLSNGPSRSPPAEVQGAAGGVDPSALNPVQYQTEFLKNYVKFMMEHMIEQHEDNVRDEIRHLHVQIIKMFEDVNARMQQLAEQCSVNPVLLQEIERLRAENDRLRRKY